MIDPPMAGVRDMRRERIGSGSAYHTVQHMQHSTPLYSWLSQGLNENLVWAIPTDCWMHFLSVLNAILHHTPSAQMKNGHRGLTASP